MTDQAVNLLPLIHQQAIATPDDLLAAALPDIIAAIPDATCGQVYRLARGGMVVWHSQDAAAVPGQYFALESDSPYQQAIDTGHITIDEQYNLLIASVQGREGVPFGLLTIECTVPPTQAARDILAGLMPQVSSALYSKQLEYLLQRQVDITSKLNEVETFQDIARILAESTLQKGQYAAINLFDYAVDDTLSGARALVTANRKESYQVDDPIDVNLSYIQIVHNALLQDGDMLVSDIETDDRFTESDRAWLKSRNVRSLYCLPLFLQNKLHGFITFIDTTKALALTPLEMQIFQNVVSQASAIIEKRRLLEQTETSLKETQQLYDLTGDLVQTTTLAEMLEVLYKHVGAGTRNVTLSQFIFDDENNLQDMVIRYIITDGKARETHIPWGENYTEEELETAIRFAEKIGDDLEILENYDNYKEEIPILKRLQAQEVNSSIAIPIFHDGKRIQQFTLAWREPRTFDERLLQLMRTAKSQITLLLKNQELLAVSQQSAQQAQEQAAQLQQISDFGQAMQASLQHTEILNAVLDFSRRILPADYVAVMTYDRAIDVLRLCARHWGEQNEVNLPGTPVEKGSNTLAESAWETRGIVQVEALQSDWDWQHPLLRSLQAVLVAPLISGGVLLGVLEVGHKQPNIYSKTDIAAFRQMRNQLALALANAETYSQSQRLARNKVMANEIIAQLQRQTDVNAILNVTAHELGKALGAKRARIRLGVDVPKPSGD